MTAVDRLTAVLRSSACKRALAGPALALFLCGALPQGAHAFGDDPVLRRMDAVMQENVRLRTESANASRKGGETAKRAREALTASDERLERTRVEALAHVAGVSQAQVEQLRHEGKSWGQAAGQLGVHPGFLGIGEAPMYQSAPKAAPARAAKTTVKARRGRKPKAVRAKGKSTPRKVAKAQTKVKKNHPAAHHKRKTAKRKR